MKATAGPTPAAIPAKWRPHYRALLSLRAVLRAETAEREAALHTPSEKGGTDAGDRALDEGEVSELLVQLTAEQAGLAEVEAALERLRAGTYGVCERTGQPIDPARLRALPWTRFSVGAAKKL